MKSIKKSRAGRKAGREESRKKCRLDADIIGSGVEMD